MRANTVKRGVGAGPVAIALAAILLALIAGAGKALPVHAAAGTFEFDQTSLSVHEGDFLDVKLVRSAGADAGSFVRVDSVPGGTAEAGDFSPSPLTITPSWNNGQSSVVLNNALHALEDADDDDETVVLELSLTGAGSELLPGIGADFQLTVTIIDDDLDRVQFEQATYSVNEGSGPVILTVVRTPSATGPASVKYITANGSASAGSDYTSTSGILSFDDTHDTRQISVPILDDGSPEGPQTFTVEIYDPSGTVLGTNAVATVTITDTAGSFRFVDASYTVAEGVASGEVILMVERIGGTTGAATVQYATSNGTASAGSDYTTTNGTLNFSSGEPDDPIVIPILNDSIPEGSETFTVTLSNPVGGPGLSAPTTATVTITDNDGVGTFSFSQSDYSIAETGATATITVVRGGSSAGTATVQYASSAGTASAGVDYTQVPLSTLTFADGQTSKTFTVTVADDTASETNETVNLTLSNPSVGYSLVSPSTAVLTIIDNETQTPVITSITPAQGPATGGNLVTITGTNLLGATQVLFGSTGASISNATSTQVLVIAPAGAAGAVNVRVTTPAGTSVVTQNAVYTYLAVPVVSGVSPNTGPLGGGTAVVITGSGFTGATAVLFGNNAATSFTVVSSTQINAVTPAGAAGDVQVRVQNANGLSATSQSTRFTYSTGASPTVSIPLAAGWTFPTWLGRGGITPTQALRGQENPDNPATIDIYNSVSVIWYWNGTQWLAFFPAGVNIPGANTLTSMPFGQPIWVYAFNATNWVTVQGP